MRKNETLNIHLSADLIAKLGAISESNGRSMVEQAAAFLEQAIAIEFPLIAMIAEGEADIAAGRVVSHDQVMSEIQARISRRRVA
jgi:predicted transcriptional regulator